MRGLRPPHAGRGGKIFAPTQRFPVRDIAGVSLPGQLRQCVEVRTSQDSGDFSDSECELFFFPSLFLLMCFGELLSVGSSFCCLIH